MSEKRFLSVETVAARLGVPAAWLKRETEAGRVPAIRAGRRLLLDPTEVERVLLDRARNGEVNDDH